MIVKYIILLLFGNIILSSCNSNNSYKMRKFKNSTTKGSPPAILRKAPFISVELSIKSNSFDSIIAIIKITNNGQKDFPLYKPLLPFDGFTEDVFGIIEKNSYEPVEFNEISKQKYMEVENSPTNYIIPILNEDSFILLKPSQSIQV